MPLGVLPKAQHLLLSIGLQPNSAIAILRGLASLKHKFETVVLVHGPNQSEFAAEMVAEFARGLQTEFSLRDDPYPNIRPMELPDIFDSGVISRVEDVLLPDLGIVDQSRLQDWLVMYGPGTVPMNVAIVGPWLRHRELWQHVWDYNETSRRITNARGDHLEFGDHSRVPLASLVRTRTARRATFSARPDGQKHHAKQDVDEFAVVIACMAGNFKAKVPANVGTLLERVVEDLFRSLLPDAVSLQRNMEMKFLEGNSSREIDMIIESPTGRVVLVSCAAVTSKKKSTSERKTDVRHKVNEIRQLAANYLGSEVRTLTVFLTNLAKGKSPAECPIITGARFDAQITNHPATKHWLISGHELFGTTKKQCRETLLDPRLVDSRLPEFSKWIRG